MKKVKIFWILLLFLLLFTVSAQTPTPRNTQTPQPVIPDPAATAKPGDDIITGAVIEGAPTGTIVTPPEYGPVYAPLLTWGVFTELMTSFLAGVTASDTDSMAYLLVRDAAAKTEAVSTLTAANVDIDRIKFIQYGFDTNWLRDYGPRSLKVNNKPALIDNDYFNSRPNDDVLPPFLGTLWNQEVYHMAIYQQGGNFLSFSNGDAFTTSIILDGNPTMTAQDIIALYKSYMNVNLTIFTSLPGGVDGTGHIDMWFCPVADNKVIIGQYASNMPGYAETEAAAEAMRSRGYTVYRVPHYNDGYQGYDGVHYTYTNCAIVNNKVYIPRYSHATQDAEAVRVFQQALPSHKIIPLDMSDIIKYLGALHCTMQHVFPAAPTVAEVVSPNGGQTLVTGSKVEIKWIALSTQPIASINLAYSVNGGASYTNIALNETHDRAYTWTVPAVSSANCLIRVLARDAGNSNAQDVSDAPFTIITSATPSPTPVSTPSPKPTPANNKGDVNSDGVTNIVDALMVAQYYVGLVPAAFVTSRADVNGDSIINIVDALMIAQYYVGLISL